MSLKSFHIVFVTVCMALFAFLMVWSFVLAPADSGVINALGYIGMAGAVLMGVYGVYFFRKARRIHL